jgi:type 1 glutamine amidotransferase
MPLLLAMTLCLAQAAPPTAKPKRILLLGQGPDGHPKETHEYFAGLRVIKKCLDRAPGVEALIVDADPLWKDGPSQIDRADGVALYLAEGARWIQEDDERLEALRRLARRGGGLAALHWGMGCREARYVAAFVDLFGGCHGGPDRKYQVAEVGVELASPNHPVLDRMRPFRVEDEFYYQLKFAPEEKGVVPLIRVALDGQPHTVAWCWQRADQGRSFGFSGGHFHRNWRLEEYRRLAAQGMLWTLAATPPEGGLDVAVEEEDLRLVP